MKIIKTINNLLYLLFRQFEYRILVISRDIFCLFSGEICRVIYHFVYTRQHIIKPFSSDRRVHLTRVYVQLRQVVSLLLHHPIFVNVYNIAVFIKKKKKKGR